MKESRERREARHDKVRLNHAMKNRPFMSTNLWGHVSSVLIIVGIFLCSIATLLYLLMKILEAIL